MRFRARAGGVRRGGGAEVDDRRAVLILDDDIGNGCVAWGSVCCCDEWPSCVVRAASRGGPDLSVNSFRWIWARDFVW